MRTSRLGFGLLAIAVGGCSSSESSRKAGGDVAVALASGTTIQAAPSNDNKAPLIMDARAEPAGVQCPAGGTALRTGRDRNLDGAIQDSEVTQIQYICN